ncbi:MAG: glycosyltransferase [Spirochaetia bacterium]
MMMSSTMRVAVVHYWLVNMRGGEKVLEALCEMFPGADIYTHAYDGSKISSEIKKHNIYLTKISRLPLSNKLYKYYLTFMPGALQDLDLNDYDLVISSESGPAKGIVLGSHVPHICYCHTPMRYLWDQYHQYVKELKGLARRYFEYQAPILRQWDLSSANAVDTFIANSYNVSRRIKRIYRRESEVIYPPVDVDLCKMNREKEDYYIFLGHLVGYKRADLAIAACLKMNRKLLIVGGGQLKGREFKNLPSHIKIIGSVSHEEKFGLLSNARAVLFPGEEDFGIVPVEATASGTPVIAYGRGGALETIKEGLNGTFFYTQTVDGIINAMRKFEEKEGLYDGRLMRMEAMKFDKSVFVRKMGSVIRQVTAHNSLSHLKNGH